tara:strand:- start:2825 stop:3685 length:861 start_codon:yes stop_codon:yes gene_type:complete
METELNIIKNSVGLTEATRRTYTYTYKRIMPLLDFTPISNISEKRILKLITESDIPVNSQNGMLSVVILIRRRNETGVELILKYKEGKQKKIMQEDKKEKNTILEQTLPSYETYANYIDELYKAKSWKSYIVNYLLFKYGVRNLDLDLIITKDKSVVSKINNVESQINYLYITPSNKYVSWIRNRYKTVQSYGRKTISITAKKFINAVNEFLQEDQFEKPLLDVGEASVGHTIRTMTYNQIAESGVYKMLFAHYKSKGDINALKKLSVSRGHDLSTAMDYYDVSDT